MSARSGKRESGNGPEASDKFTKASWEKIWADGLAPGDYFDEYFALPELTKELSSGSFATTGRALVPGCGRGYDVEALCRAGFVTIGLDVSKTAVMAAREYLDKVSTPGEFRVVSGDFFTTQLGVFDLVYDYTFFCAIPVELRAQWGARMVESVRKGGHLITVMFPMGRGLEQGGPPFGVSEQAYRDALGDSFVAVDGPRKLDSDGAHQSRGNGNSYWCRWRRV